MEPQSNYATHYDHATHYVFLAIRYLRDHLSELDPDSGEAMQSYCALQELFKAVDILSPSEGDWPAAKDGMGKILTFVPRRA